MLIPTLILALVVALVAGFVALMFAFEQSNQTPVTRSNATASGPFIPAAMPPLAAA